LAAIRSIVAVFGASGLIGEAIATGLAREGFSVVAVARRFPNAQKAEFSASAVECPIVSLNSATLVHLLSERSVVSIR